MQTNKMTPIALAVAASLSLAWQSTAIAAEPAATDNTDDVEVIQVRGIRGSLKQALNNKRFANSVVDSVSSEDIGNVSG